MLDEGWAEQRTERREALLVELSHVKLRGLQHRWGQGTGLQWGSYLSGDSGKVFIRRLSSSKGKRGFQAQKMLELSPEPGGCRVCGKHSQQPTGFHPTASSPSASSPATLPDNALIHHGPAQRPPWAGAQHFQQTIQHSTLKAEVLPGQAIFLSLFSWAWLSLSKTLAPPPPCMVSYGIPLPCQVLPTLQKPPPQKACYNSFDLFLPQRSVWTNSMIFLRFQFITYMVTSAMGIWVMEKVILELSQHGICEFFNIITKSNFVIIEVTKPHGKWRERNIPFNNFMQPEDLLNYFVW